MLYFSVISIAMVLSVMKLVEKQLRLLWIVGFSILVIWMLSFADTANKQLEKIKNLFTGKSNIRTMYTAPMIMVLILQ